MAGYTLAVGTHDPVAIDAAGDREAVVAATTLVRERYADDVSRNPQEVATLLGPDGLVTRPSERLDEFLGRVGTGPAALDGTVEPGQVNSPDCNGD